jgi:hypothetical protein
VRVCAERSDELFFSQIREEAVADEQLQQAATANALEGFKIVFENGICQAE